jgi:hypothetical protein
VPLRAALRAAALQRSAAPHMGRPCPAAALALLLAVLLGAPAAVGALRPAPVARAAEAQALLPVDVGTANFSAIFSTASSSKAKAVIEFYAS